MATLYACFTYVKTYTKLLNLYKCTVHILYMFVRRVNMFVRRVNMFASCYGMMVSVRH